jgi:hypothetical protein
VINEGGIRMRKVMLLAAVMAMVLAAAPAFAQANAVGGSVQYVDCDQIQAAATGQYNVANDQEALAALAQELGVDQNQVLACFRSIAAGRDVNINTASASAAMATATAKAGKAGKAGGGTATATAGGGGGGGGGSAAAASAAAGGALPPTGGAPILALGAGALLVAGGLLARRIVR